jgi:hypothetical protein
MKRLWTAWFNMWVAINQHYTAWFGYALIVLNLVMQFWPTVGGVFPAHVREFALGIIGVLVVLLRARADIKAAVASYVAGTPK